MIIVLLFNKLSTKGILHEKNCVCVAVARFRTNLGDLRISIAGCCFVRMTDNNGFPWASREFVE